MEEHAAAAEADRPVSFRDKLKAFQGMGQSQPQLVKKPSPVVKPTGSIADRLAVFNQKPSEDAEPRVAVKPRAVSTIQSRPGVLQEDVEEVASPLASLENHDATAAVEEGASSENVEPKPTEGSDAPKPELEEQAAPPVHDTESTNATKDPVESEKIPSEEPVESEKIPSEEPVESEKSPSEEPVESEKIPAKDPVESEKLPARGNAESQKPSAKGGIASRLAIFSGENKPEDKPKPSASPGKLGDRLNMFNQTQAQAQPAPEPIRPEPGKVSGGIASRVAAFTKPQETEKPKVSATPPPSRQGLAERIAMLSQCAAVMKGGGALERPPRLSADLSNPSARPYWQPGSSDQSVDDTGSTESVDTGKRRRRHRGRHASDLGEDGHRHHKRHRKHRQSLPEGLLMEGVSSDDGGHHRKRRHSREREMDRASHWSDDSRPHPITMEHTASDDSERAMRPTGASPIIPARPGSSRDDGSQMDTVVAAKPMVRRAAKPIRGRRPGALKPVEE